MIHELLELLDVSLVVGDAFPQCGDVVREGGRFGRALVLYFLTPFRVGFELRLESLQFSEILILHLRILHLDDGQLLFVLFAGVSEPVCELVSLLRVELLRVITIGPLGLADLVYLLL